MSSGIIGQQQQSPSIKDLNYEVQNEKNVSLKIVNEIRPK